MFFLVNYNLAPIESIIIQNCNSSHPVQSRKRMPMDRNLEYFLQWLCCHLTLEVETRNICNLMFILLSFCNYLLYPLSFTKYRFLERNITNVKIWLSSWTLDRILSTAMKYFWISGLQVDVELKSPFSC